MITDSVWCICVFFKIKHDHLKVQNALVSFLCFSQEGCGFYIDYVKSLLIKNMNPGSDHWFSIITLKKDNI